ncbi:MAG: hypothetical protein U0746_08985 [Gemmataceae bacterium]
MRLDRLTIFSHLWAIAGVAEAARWMWDEVPWNWVLLPTSLALFAFPGSVACLVIFAITQIGFHALVPHMPWNHGLFMALMNGAILASVARVYTRTSRGDDRPATREAIVDHFAPTLRLSLIFLYGWAFVHKLNWDFLDPKCSCAGYLLPFLNTKYGVLPTGVAMTQLGIWSTLIVESAVPVLLCFRRTIGLAMVLGTAFHLFLSQFGGLFGFAAVMYAVYFLFLPPSFTDDLANRMEDVLTRLYLRRFRSWLSPMLALAIPTTGLLLRAVHGSSALDTGLWWWNAWVLLVVGCFARPLELAIRAPAAVPLTPVWRPLWAVPVVVLVNGACPYLGLKTETSWSMYSNLRTEVRPNHLFMPEWLKVASYQDDLVEIVETSHPALQGYRQPGPLMTFFEFRRTCSQTTEDFRVVYRRNGVECVLELVNGVSTDPTVTRPHGWLMDNLLRFRPVDATGPATCRH